MKMAIALAMIAASCVAHADEFVQYSDGSTAFKTESGHVFGRSGGEYSARQANPDAYSSQPQTGYTDNQGTYYAPAGDGGSVNTRTGQYIPAR